MTEVRYACWWYDAALMLFLWTVKCHLKSYWPSTWVSFAHIFGTKRGLDDIQPLSVKGFIVRRRRWLQDSWLQHRKLCSVKSAAISRLKKLHSVTKAVVSEDWPGDFIAFGQIQARVSSLFPLLVWILPPVSNHYYTAHLEPVLCWETSFLSFLDGYSARTDHRLILSVACCLSLQNLTRQPLQQGQNSAVCAQSHLAHFVFCLFLSSGLTSDCRG